MALKFRAVEHHKGSSCKPTIEFLYFDMLAPSIQKGETIVCDGIFDSIPGVYRVTIKKLGSGLKEVLNDDPED